MIKCHTCGSDNRHQRKFCGQCGARLAAPCVACDFGNYPDERYCGGCGVPLTSDVVAAAPSAPQSRATAERRQLTVMFCDMVGSTALSGQLDAEDLRDVITDFQRACREQVEHAGGFVARYMGDALLVYFGYPAAREDDAELAVRAGLAVVSAVGQLDHDITARVGIATGMVVAGDLIGEGVSEERAVVGQTPNLAARLESIAGPNQVVVSASTLRLVRGLFEFEDLGLQTLKGFDEPQGAFHIVDVARVATRFDAQRAQGRRVALVGREAELGLLNDRWARAAESESQVVQLIGDAGYGKSHVVAAFVDAIAEDHIHLNHQCAQYYQSTPLHPVVDEIRRRADLAGVDTDDERLDRLEAMFEGTESEQRDAVHHVARLLSISAAGRYDSGGVDANGAIEALVAQVATMQSRAPMVIVFEDVQWIDPSTRSFAERVIARCSKARVLLLLTSRADSAVAEGPNVTTLSLNRLSARHTQELISAVAGAPLPADIEREIVARTDGVPAFVEAVTRTLLGSGGFRRSNGEWVVDRDVTPRAIPESIQDSLMAQLDQLGPQRALAQTAAVVGRSFGLGLLSEIVGRPAEETRADLEALVNSGLLDRHDERGQPIYLFRHALVRDIAYETLLKRTRREIHQRIAEVLEGRVDAESTPELIARHYCEAGQQGSAVVWFGKAATMAIDRVAPDEAKSLLEQLRASIEASDPSPAAQLITLEIDLASVLRLVGEFDDALAALERAEALIETSGLTEELARLHNTRGNILHHSGDPADCLAAHQLSLDAARRAGNVKDEVRALGGVGDAMFVSLDFDAGREKFNTCVEMALEHGFDRIAAANAPMIVLSDIFRGSLDAALAAGLHAIEIAQKCGHVRALGFADLGVALVLLSHGRYGEALEHQDRARPTLQRMGLHFVLYERLMRVRLLRALGDSDALRAEIDAALQQASGKHFTAEAGFLAARRRLDDDASETLDDLANMFMSRKATTMLTSLYVAQELIEVAREPEFETVDRILRHGVIPGLRRGAWTGYSVEHSLALMRLRVAPTPTNIARAHELLAQAEEFGAVHEAKVLREALADPS